MLKKLRGGKPLRVPFRQQILILLAGGEKRTAEFMDAIDGQPKAIDNELRRLIEIGEIVRVRRGVYALPDSKNSEKESTQFNDMNATIFILFLFVSIILATYSTNVV